MTAASQQQFADFANRCSETRRRSRVVLVILNMGTSKILDPMVGGLTIIIALLPLFAKMIGEQAGDIFHRKNFFPQPARVFNRG